MHPAGEFIAKVETEEDDQEKTIHNERGFEEPSNSFFLKVRTLFKAP